MPREEQWIKIDWLGTKRLVGYYKVDWPMTSGHWPLPEVLFHLDEVGSDDDGDALPCHQPQRAHQVEKEQVESKACLEVKQKLKKKSTSEDLPRSLPALGLWDRPKEAEAVADRAWHQDIMIKIIPTSWFLPCWHYCNNLVIILTITKLCCWTLKSEL